MFFLLKNSYFIRKLSVYILVYRIPYIYTMFLN